MGRCRATLLWAAAVVGLSWASPARAGYALFDVAEERLLEAADADQVVEPGRVADLLLVVMLQTRLASSVLTFTTRVPVVAVPGDLEPDLSKQQTMEVGELLQLLLLSGSRTAAKTLAATIDADPARMLGRLRRAASVLGLGHTTLADDWPVGRGTGASRGGTTARDAGRLALLVANDPEMRRRLSLDGVPVADGGLIARATAPLIAVAADAKPAPSSASLGRGPRIGLAEQNGLALLAVTTGPKADEELTAALARGFERYRRVEVVHAGQSIGPNVHVRGGIIPSFKAVAAESWALTTRTASPGAVAFRLQLPSEVAAPVDVRQPLGELVVEQAGQLLTVVPLVAPQAIAPSGWLDTARGPAGP